MKSFQEQVAEELEKARFNHPTNMHSAHEAYGVIAEEMLELLAAVRSVKLDSAEWIKPECVVLSKCNFHEELVQIAAMCQRASEDLNLIPADE